MQLGWLEVLVESQVGEHSSSLAAAPASPSPPLTFAFHHEAHSSQPTNIIMS